MNQELKNVVKALLDPKSYDEEVEKVELIQTHISYVFLTGKYVYKIKKPVNFGFLDFSSMEKRKFFCEKELELNRRLCGNMYLEVVPINLENGKIKIKGGGKTIEYAVKMKQMPQEAMMSKLLEKNKVDKELIDRIAKIIVDFHSKAETGKKVNEYGLVETVKFNWDENFDQTKEFIGRTIEKNQFFYIKQKINRFMNENKNLFEKRISGGRIRDCHGDLHSGNVFVNDGIYIFDAIEFNERFRYSDVAADVAFFVMDLDFHGKQHLAGYFLERYLKYSGDEGLTKLLKFYSCYRAYVRGKVTTFKLNDKGIGKKEKKDAGELAKKYFDLAFGYAAELKTKPILFVMCGLMATGKSWLAKRLADIIDAKIIRSDVVRKELARRPLTAQRYEDYKKGIYTEEFTEKTYGEMTNMAKKLLEKNISCILDATFSKKKYREEAREIAKELSIPFFIIECVAPEEVIRQRLERRIKRKSVSEGRWELYHRQKRDLESILPTEKPVVVDATKPAEECLNIILNKISF